MTDTRTFVDPDEQKKKPDFVDPEAEAASGRLGSAALYGAVGAAGAWGLGRFGRWAFPGLRANKAFLSGLDSALKKDFGKDQGLKSALPRYTMAARDSEKPMTFADWIALQSYRAPETTKLLNEVIDRGGAPNVLAKNLVTRGAGSKERVLSDLSGALGVQEQTLQQTIEQLAKAKRDNAEPLYKAAFKDKSPLVNQRVYDLFDKYPEIMEGALENAKEASKYDPSRQVESQTIKALSGPRKDAWRWVLNPEAGDIPQSLYVGEPKNNLQTVITPNIETLDRMKRAIWSLQKKRVKEGADDVGSIIQARKELTALADELGPPEYKQARKQYAGDIALEEAADLGANILKQNPVDLRNRLLTMSPEERAAMGQGFYGSLQNMDEQKFVREIVSGNPAYQRKRDLLSAVFPDTNALNSFLQNLGGEEAMQAGKTAFVKQGTAESEKQPFHIGAALNPMRAHAYLFDVLPMPPYDPFNRVPAAGQSIMFKPPQFHPGGMEHPALDPAAQYVRPYISGGGGYGSPTMEFGVPAAAGALGAAAPYLYDYLRQE